MYPRRERRPTRVLLESKMNIEIDNQRKQDIQNKKQQVAAEALLLLNPSTKSSIGVPHTDSTNNLDIVSSKMTDIINQLYGENMVNEWKNSAKRPRYGRDIYEISSIPTQCKNTLGRAEDAGGCWICGFPFDNNVPHMRPSCDHVLPVAQAVFFLGLYSTRKVIPTEKQELKDTIYKLEYAWAHRGCNILKSNINFIKEATDPIHKIPQWTVDEANINQVLRTIQKTNSKEWFDTRRRSIIERVKKITDFISRPEEPGLGNLTVLAGWASLVDPTSMTDDFLDFIDVKLPPNVVATSRRKRSMSPSSDTDPPAKRMRVGATRRRKIRKSRKTYKWRRSF